MASFTGKPIKDVYKDILHTSNSNTGLSTTLKQITCGDGDVSALQLSTTALRVLPASDGTRIFQVEDKDGNDLFNVDSTNDKVKAGVGQHTVNTSFYEFNIYQFTPVIAEHNPMQAGGGGSHYTVSYDGDINGSNYFGAAANPSGTGEITSESYGLVASAWYIPEAIRIDTVSYLISCSAASTVNIHLQSYTIATGSGVTAGNLSSLENVALSGSAADNLVPLTVGDDRITNGTLTKLITEITAGKVILCFMENVGGTDAISGKVIVKYHLK